MADLKGVINFEAASVFCGKGRSWRRKRAWRPVGIASTSSRMIDRLFALLEETDALDPAMIIELVKD